MQFALVSLVKKMAIDHPYHTIFQVQKFSVLNDLFLEDEIVRFHFLVAFFFWGGRGSEI